ncbi:substrate-binding periplasmic protein [Pseudoalteromonas sp. SSDWG2]|uniref:substrate-binding periplasmic protein n=1 Tax=Pseudoalteromonas sp. SSDWG2 TaxID=3139391 RepID=UPI003BAA18F0
MIKYLLFFFVTFIGFNAHGAKIHVKVGAGLRPPFMLQEGKGMGPEIINAFNLVQDEFHFELVSVPIARRVMSLSEGWVDIVMWDNLEWGWGDDMHLLASNPLLQSQDSFISHISARKDQRFFDSFHDKVICGVNGYHYRFLNYQTDYKTIKEMFDIVLVRTEEESIKMALNKRCDISVASASALDWFFVQHPEERANILISDKFDTQYTRSFLVPEYSPISVQEINNILNKANALGLLAPIYKQYGQRF